MENLYKLITILFVLSLISERIANFFKLKLSGSRQRLKSRGSILKWFTFGNTSLKKTDPQEEKQREFRVLKINLFFGCLIAICFHADLFILLQHIDRPNDFLNWSHESTSISWEWSLKTFGKLLLALLGCLLTGAFISFGSKFWHDTLDLLLQVKNYRGMLAAEKSQEIQANASTMSDEGLDLLMRSAIDEHYQDWKLDYPNIVGCTVGLKRTGGSPVAKKAIIFKVRQKPSADQLSSTATIPTSITYRGSVLPTDVIDTGEISALMSPAKESTLIRTGVKLGTSVSRDNASNFGTVSLRVKQTFSNLPDQYFLLSCFHVLFPERLDPNVLQQGTLKVDLATHGPDTLISAPASVLNTPKPDISTHGHVTAGVFSSRIDAAIARINQTDLLQQTFNDTLVTGEADLKDLYVGMPVNSFGCVTGKLTGFINDLDVPVTEVVFKNGPTRFSYTFNKLMQVSMPCKEGDSGAPVLSPNGKIIGIITSGDNEGSYVLPFQYIKNALFVTL